ncbi:hypothetical protein A0H81_10829 [Grifola frondosa]|uniref:Uncharacterized protein n=1 Tax=Grifola frondosa TaxID=5627 RepID=A0A1C7LYK2_GRIFR|nr:hypothetical protein A0H81_10829 [Grifola frondosa]
MLVKSALNHLHLTQAAKNVQLLGLFNAHKECLTFKPPKMIDLFKIMENNGQILAELHAVVISGTAIISNLGPN